MHLAQPHHVTVHWLGHTRMLFTKPSLGNVLLRCRPSRKNLQFSNHSQWTDRWAGTKQIERLPLKCDEGVLIGAKFK